MRREFCDRCGLEGMSRVERRAAQHGFTQAGVKVVRVTMVPLARVMDLCGPCRRSLDGMLDEFLACADAYASAPPEPRP